MFSCATIMKRNTSYLLFIKNISSFEEAKKSLISFIITIVLGLHYTSFLGDLSYKNHKQTFKIQKPFILIKVHQDPMTILNNPKISHSKKLIISHHLIGLEFQCD